MARDEGGNALNRAHRRRFLLSGLLVCGVCGGGYTIMGKDRYGCAAHRSKGTCGNDRTIGRQAIEGRVLDGLKHRLLAPELFEAFARAYQEECNRLAREARSAAGRRSRAGWPQVERKIAAMIRAIEDGLYQPSMKERMATLEAEKARLVAELAAKPDAARRSPCTPTCRCSTGARSRSWRRLLADPELGAEAMEAIRAMITPDRADAAARRAGWTRCCEGDLARILAICDGGRTQNARRVSGGRSGAVPVSQVSVVAGAGFEPATFRL